MKYKEINIYGIKLKFLCERKWKNPRMHKFNWKIVIFICDIEL